MRANKEELFKLIPELYQYLDQNTLQKIVIDHKQNESKEPYRQKAFGEQYFPCVGMLQSIWLDKTSAINRPKKYLYGTAFLVSPTVIITCTHNVYDPRQKQKADEVKFIPGQNGYIISERIVYQCLQFKFLPFEKDTSLDLYPTINDLCICRLQKGVKTKYLIPMQAYSPPLGANLTIIAYPNKGYRENAFNLLSVCLDRRHSNGKLVSTSKDIISYEIVTQPGCSGAPILAKKGQKVYLVGMHSHSGGNNNRTNEGLFFSQKTWTILEYLMQSFENEQKIVVKEIIENNTIQQYHSQQNNESMQQQIEDYEYYKQVFDRNFVYIYLPPTKHSDL